MFRHLFGLFPRSLVASKSSYNTAIPFPKPIIDAHRPVISSIPEYTFPILPATSVAGALLSGKHRSFRRDASRCLTYLRPGLRLCGAQHIPSSAPFLITVNHYSRPGFNAVWTAFAVSATVPVEIHWLITSAWTFPGRRLRRPARKISEWVLYRLSIVYGFTPLPPMPPDPLEVQARALAVKRALNYARQTPAPAIGLAPEGQDAPGGRLCVPPAGVGRFIVQLLNHCQSVVPIGIFEEGGYLCAQFGAPYTLEIPPDLHHKQLDQYVSGQVMAAIARELPSHLRGEYE